MAHTRCAGLRIIVRARADHLNGGLCMGRVQRADCAALLSTDDAELRTPSEKVLISHSAFSYRSAAEHHIWAKHHAAIEISVFFMVTFDLPFASVIGRRGQRNSR